MPTRRPSSKAKKTNVEYPPIVFKTRLRELISEHPEKPTIEVLAAHVGVTPLTLRRILNGCDVRMSIAFQLASYLDPKSLHPLEEIWKPC